MSTIPYLIVANQLDGLPENLGSVVRESGGKITHEIPQIGVALATSESPDFALDTLELPGIRAVVPDLQLDLDGFARPVTLDLTKYERIEQLAADGDLSPLQWGLEAISAPDAWAAGATGEGVRVAILDGGIVSDHPDIAANLNTELSTSFVPGETFEFTPADGSRFSHATHVAGIVSGVNDSAGIVGVAPDSELVAVKVLSDRVFDTATSFISQLVSGIVYSAQINADVVNMSLGGNFPRKGGTLDPGTPNDPTDDFTFTKRDVREIVKVVSRATRFAHKQGTTLIAAAGNESLDGKDHSVVVVPRDMPHVISVSATGPRGLGKDAGADPDEPAYYTNYGRSVIDLAAPGGNIDFGLFSSGEVCANDLPCYLYDMVVGANAPGSSSLGAFNFSVGTSFSAPHVTGVAALVIGEQGQDSNPSKVRALLTRTADDLGEKGKDDFYGHGRINALKSLLAAAEHNGAEGVVAKLNAKGTLVVRGDDLANSITIDQTGLRSDQYRITGHNTKVNGRTVPLILENHSRSVRVDLGDGDDSIMIGNANDANKMFFTELKLDGGDGDNVSLLNDVVVDGKLAIKNSDGSDTSELFSITADDLRIANSVGGSDILLRDVSVANKLSIENGDGFDAVLLERVDVGEKLSLRNRNGGSSVELESTSVGGKLRIKNEAGFDSLVVADSEIGDDVMVDNKSEGSSSRFVDVTIGRDLVIKDGKDDDRVILVNVQVAGDTRVPSDSKQEPLRGCQNPVSNLDVNDDGLVTAIDSLLILDALQTGISPDCDPEQYLGPFLDVTGDGFVTEEDARLIIEFLEQPA